MPFIIPEDAQEDNAKPKKDNEDAKKDNATPKKDNEQEAEDGESEQEAEDGESEHDAEDGESEHEAEAAEDGESEQEEQSRYKVIGIGIIYIYIQSFTKIKTHILKTLAFSCFNSTIQKT